MLSPCWRSILLTTTWHLACSVYWWTWCHLACREYYIKWLSSCLTIAWHDWHTISVLSPCWRSILLTTTDNWACLVYCFHVCVSHLTNIHTIVSSLQHLLGIPSLQQLAFKFVSWWVCVCVCVFLASGPGGSCNYSISIATSSPRESPRHMCYPVVLALRSPWGAFRRGFQWVPCSLDSVTRSDVTT